MTRRQFIKILSGALVMWPQASHGQPPVIPVVGFLHSETPGSQMAATEIDKAFDTLIERQAGALLIAADVFYSAHIQRLVSLVTRYKMPAMYYRREFPATGGLASYGTSVTDAYRQAGIYVARILNGDKPGELPVMQTVKFEFILNLKTARTLGIDVSMAFSAAADEIIE